MQFLDILDEFDEKDKEKKTEDEESEYEFEDDEVVKRVFIDEDEIEVIDEDEEVIPQNKEDYVVQSQIIQEGTDSLKPINLVKEMRDSFLDYAMSVIVSRALPDARDGLKPVHRRILYGMYNLKITASSQYKKSARIVGDVLGKYHPHGDSSVYEAMVRMAQSFSLRYPLIDGHGNFGSIDGDSAAAMRYTEARMSKIAGYMVEDIEKNTVKFIDNYDASEKEPVVLPAKFPNLLVSGTSGIAVGMATAIPPHNIGEVIDATIELAKNPEITIDELSEFINGPDFPTGAFILGKSGIKSAYHTGKGSVVIRSKTKIEQLKNGKSRIVVTEIPYEVKTDKLNQKIDELHKAKIIEGISEIRDESSRKGIRIVIEVKKGVMPEIVLNKLFKHTSLQHNFSVNLVALVNGEPKLLNLKQALEVYLKHQVDVVTRRIEFDLDKAEQRIHILKGLKIAVENIDQVIAIIRSSKTDAEAQAKLSKKLLLDSIQTKAIIDMRLGRLTGLAIDKMIAELIELDTIIADFKSLLASKEKLINLIIEELELVKEKFNDPRRTTILEESSGITDEDLITKKDVIITLTSKGYVKRIPVEEYRTQKRGGVGSNTTTTYSDDNVELILTANTHTDLLIFTNFAKVYKIRTHQLPEQNKQGKGKPFINIIKIAPEEVIVSLLVVDKYEEGDSLVTITKMGIIKKTPISEYRRINSNGKIALKIQENDYLVRSFIVKDSDEIIIGASNGKAVRFESSAVRNMGRTSTGIKAISLDKEKEYVVGASKSSEGQYIFAIGALGFGKKTHIEEYRKTKRGAKGVSTINYNKSGDLVYLGVVEGDEDILTITSSGTTIRTSLSHVAVSSRTTKGVKIISLKNNKELIKSVTKVSSVEEDIETTEFQNEQTMQSNQE